MSIAEALLTEFDHEMGVTRRLLERVPDGQFGWKPHEKSMTLGRLAEHFADLLYWCAVTITESSHDVTRLRPDGYQSPTTRAALIALFDKSLTTARAAIAGRTDAEMLANWTLTKQGQELFTMPKASVLRLWVMNHMIHHRGQLSVYLRLQNIPVPSIYGPSADEQL